MTEKAEIGHTVIIISRGRIVAGKFKRFLPQKEVYNHEVLIFPIFYRHYDKSYDGLHHYNPNYFFEETVSSFDNYRLDKGKWESEPSPYKRIDSIFKKLKYQKEIKE